MTFELDTYSIDELKLLASGLEAEANDLDFKIDNGKHSPSALISVQADSFALHTRIARIHSMIGAKEMEDFIKTLTPNQINKQLLQF